MTRILLCCLGAVILILAGLGAAKTTLDGLQNDEIMATGRRTSHLVVKESEPRDYWITIIGSGVISVGLLAGGGLLVLQAFKPGKKT